jgi:hypothetical protein
VVYRDVTRQAKGLYHLKHVGALGSGLTFLSRYNSGWFCHTSAPEGSTPTEPALEADATLPDLPPPELQQVKTGASGREQVEAPDAAPADGTGKHLTAHG